MFYKHHVGDTTIMLVYVDDILLTGSNVAYLTQLDKQLHGAFALRDLCDINYFLDFKMKRTDDFFISPSAYMSMIFYINLV